MGNSRRWQRSKTRKPLLAIAELPNHTNHTHHDDELHESQHGGCRYVADAECTQGDVTFQRAAAGATEHSHHCKRSEAVQKNHCGSRSHSPSNERPDNGAPDSDG